MFVFKKEQQVFDFGGVKIGGQPGQNPTVLIGGLFFKGQPIVESTKEGRFDKRLTREWIETGVSQTKETGHPLIIQAYGRTPTAMENHISWLAENYEGPFMFESTSAKARKFAIQYCEEQGLEDRAIYNSINLSMKDAEKDLLSASKLNMAVVLGWSPRATTLPDRMTTIESMIEDAEGMGITKMVVDPATMPVGAGYGLENRTMLAIKSELGLPTCLGPHNAPSAWKLLKKEGFDDESTHLSAVVASTVASQLFATDCIMYGSMIRTKEVFVAVALIGNAIAAATAEANRALGIERSLFEPRTID
ncbi:MAG: Tetrahydromethanopterin S-methyltransferase subunit H [Candidatus Thorarchaeota archaeon]|nr:MAG: Tetrahydromethanopterin S-methyltransferase subunit H [Candidatus Thorarchaeota archaeon]